VAAHTAAHHKLQMNGSFVGYAGEKEKLRLIQRAIQLVGIAKADVSSIKAITVNTVMVFGM
jgi:hypothetical protein